MKNLFIEGEDVALIKKTTLVREYQSDTEGFKGKKYRIYAWGDKAFAVHEDDTFHDDLEQGNVKKVFLTENEEGQLSLANYVTWSKAINIKKRQVEFDSIGKEYSVANMQSVTEVETLS